MKPITLIVDRDVQLHKGDYIIVTSETKFFVAYANEETEEAAVKKEKRKYVKGLTENNGKRVTRSEMELRKERLLNLILKSPGKTSQWYKKQMNLNNHRLGYALKKLIDAKLVKCSYTAKGRINPWQPITPM